MIKNSTYLRLTHTGSFPAWGSGHNYLRVLLYHLLSGPPSASTPHPEQRMLKIIQSSAVTDTQWNNTVAFPRTRLSVCYAWGMWHERQDEQVGIKKQKHTHAHTHILWTFLPPLLSGQKLMCYLNPVLLFQPLDCGPFLLCNKLSHAPFLLTPELNLKPFTQDMQMQVVYN